MDPAPFKLYNIRSPLEEVKKAIRSFAGAQDDNSMGVDNGRSGGPQVVIIHINNTWSAARRFFPIHLNTPVILNEVKDLPLANEF